MIKKILSIIFYTAGVTVSAVLISVAAGKFTHPLITNVIFLRMFENGSIQFEKDYKSLKYISENLQKAVIASEDGRFFEHSGIDWDAVEEAKRYNLKHKGKKKRGASTITMQTAKNVYLWHGRNYLRKGFEVIFTVLIDEIWGKKRVLEHYLNICEWEENVYGAEAAALHHFNKSSDKLTKRQAALLAVVLPNPIRWSASKPTNYINKRAGTISARMNSVDLKKMD